MKASMWLRALAVVMLLFALGHTLGTASPKVTRGPVEGALFAAMQGYRFPVMGFERSHWDFYRGFAQSISVWMVVVAVIAWQVAQVGRRNAGDALPLAVTLLVGCVGQLLLAARFFFALLMVLAAAAVGCAAMAVVLLRWEARA